MLTQPYSRLLPGCTTYMGASTQCCPKAGDIVSVGLQDDWRIGVRRLIPYKEFGLEIFIFNQSEWMRRFEMTFLERRQRWHKHVEGAG
jgi:hypothetical protein